MDLHAENMILRTARLTLRPIQLSDEAVMVREINDIAISGWLATVPHPYTAQDFRLFATEIAVPGETFAIEDAEGVVGVIGLESHILGYWLAARAHGKGYATEAARCLLHDHFSRSEETVESGYFVGNTRSGRVLEKLGFTQTGQDMKHCLAMGVDRPHRIMMLTPQAFARA
jgi:RimJ/RimL family protein N-acetyltransferase